MRKVDEHHHKEATIYEKRKIKNNVMNHSSKNLNNF